MTDPVAVTCWIPRQVAENVDRVAEKEDRTRSKQLTKILKDWSEANKSTR